MRRRQAFAVMSALAEQHKRGMDQPTVEETLTLAEQYREKFGKPPHHRMKDETILARLEE